MKNVCIITSVIHTPNVEWSYTKIRSVFNGSERYIQTQDTINSIRAKIPDVFILMVECSKLSEIEELYLKSSVDHFINIYDNEQLRNNCHSRSKSLGEGTQTIVALDWLKDKKYSNLFKVSGRYYLNDNFDYNRMNNNFNICRLIRTGPDVDTFLYKLNHSTSQHYNSYLKNNINRMRECIGYETLFGIFLQQMDYQDTVLIRDGQKIGCSGLFACGTVCNK